MTNTNRLLKKEYLAAQQNARINEIISQDRQARIMRKLKGTVDPSRARWQKIMALRSSIEKEILPTLTAIRTARSEIFHEPHLVQSKTHLTPIVKQPPVDIIKTSPLYGWDKGLWLG